MSKEIEEKKECPCDQLTVVKKGFNGKEAVIGFLGILVGSAVILAVVIGYTAEIDQTFRGNMAMCSADI